MKKIYIYIFVKVNKIKSVIISEIYITHKYNNKYLCIFFEKSSKICTYVRIYNTLYSDYKRDKLIIDKNIIDINHIAHSRHIIYNLHGI